MNLSGKKILLQISQPARYLPQHAMEPKKFGVHLRASISRGAFLNGIFLLGSKSVELLAHI